MVDFGPFVGTSLRALDVEGHFLLGMILLPSVTVGQGQFELFLVKKERKKKKTHKKKQFLGRLALIVGLRNQRKASKCES